MKWNNSMITKAWNGNSDWSSPHFISKSIPFKFEINCPWPTHIITAARGQWNSDRHFSRNSVKWIPLGDEFHGSIYFYYHWHLVFSDGTYWNCKTPCNSAISVVDIDRIISGDYTHGFWHCYVQVLIFCYKCDLHLYLSHSWNWLMARYEAIYTKRKTYKLGKLNNILWFRRHFFNQVFVKLISVSLIHRYWLSGVLFPLSSNWKW